MVVAVVVVANLVVVVALVLVTGGTGTGTDSVLEDRPTRTECGLLNPPFAGRGKPAPPGP